MAPEATVPVGSVSPVAHWTSEATSSDGTPFVLRADTAPPDDATLSDVEPSAPSKRVSQPTQRGLPDARSFLSTPEATVQMNPDAHGEALSDAPATLPLGSISSFAHAPVVATRPSPFENAAMPPAAQSPLLAMTRPQVTLPPHDAPQPQPYAPTQAVSLGLSNALPPRAHEPWRAPSQPQPQPARTAPIAMLVGLVIVSVLVMVTLVVAVLASRR